MKWVIKFRINRGFGLLCGKGEKFWDGISSENFSSKNIKKVRLPRFRRHIGKDCQWIAGLLRGYEQEPHSLSLAKKAVAFLGCPAPSAGACYPDAAGPAPHALPGSEHRGALPGFDLSPPHSRRAVSVRSGFLATCARLWRSARTSLTASALNSAVNRRLFLVVKFTSMHIIAPSQVSTKAGESQ